MQSLYEWDFHGNHPIDTDEVVDRNLLEFAPGLEDFQERLDLIRTLREKPPGRRSYVYVNNRLEGNALATIEAILRLLEAD